MRKSLVASLVLSLYLVMPWAQVMAYDGARLIMRQFRGFSVMIDCERHGAVYFQYVLTRDTGSEERVENFELDDELPSRCQQRTSDTYKAAGQRYDRGHLVPANHLDHDALAIAQSNMMSNILPQAANMNRGAWYETEKLSECYRDLGTVMVFGGVIWGNNADDDFFMRSHGVATPDAFWKILQFDGRLIAWVVPNSQAASASKLSSYVVDLETLSGLTGLALPFPGIERDRKPANWAMPSGCKIG